MLPFLSAAFIGCGDLLPKTDPATKETSSNEFTEPFKPLRGKLSVAWPAQEGMSLNALQPDIGIQVSGCKSGYSQSEIFSGESGSIRLYEGDRGCLARVYQINFDGGQYFVQTGYAFSIAVGQITPFKEISSEKYLYVKVLSQLHVTLGVDENISFAVSQTEMGTGTQLDGFVVVSASPDITEIAETGGGLITYTIAANETSPSPVTIHYSFGGTATPGLDYVTPSGTSNGSVILPANTASVPLTITVIDDLIPEYEELISFTFLTGFPGYFPVNESANIIVSDDDVYLPTAAKVLHLEPNGLVNAAGQVPTWTDSSGQGHNATQSNSTLQPTFISAGINGFSAAGFLDTKYMTLANDPDFNTATSPYTAKQLSG